MNSKSWQDGLFHGTKWRENYQCSRLWFKILTGRTFSRNKMARKLSVFSSLMSNYSFNDNFCQKMIIYLESVQKQLYFDTYIYFFLKPIKYKNLDRTDFYRHLERESRTKNKCPDDSRSTKWYLNGWLWFLSNKFICF